MHLKQSEMCGDTLLITSWYRACLIWSSILRGIGCLLSFQDVTVMLLAKWPSWCTPYNYDLSNAIPDSFQPLSLSMAWHGDLGNFVLSLLGKGHSHPRPANEFDSQVWKKRTDSFTDREHSNNSFPSLSIPIPSHPNAHLAVHGKSSLKENEYK